MLLKTFGGKESDRLCCRKAKGSWRSAACGTSCWKRQRTMKVPLRSGKAMVIVSKPHSSATTWAGSTLTKCGKFCRPRRTNEQQIREFNNGPIERLEELLQGSSPRCCTLVRGALPGSG